MKSLAALLCFTILAAGAGESLAFDPLFSKSSIRSEPVSSCAAQVPQDQALTLSDVVHFALCNNPQTRLSWANVLAQAARVGQSRSAYLPSASANATYDYNRYRGGRFGGYNQKGATYGVTLDYLLFDFGGRESNINLTRQQLKALDYNHNAVLQNVVFSAVQAYYQYYAAQGALAAAEETLKSTQSSLEAANLRLEVGAVTVADQLQAETANSQSVLQKASAENQLRVSKGTLANIMGLEPSYKFEVDTDIVMPEAPGINDDIETLLKQAKKTRPDLAASEADVKAARANVSQQRAAGLPSLSLGAGRDYDRIYTGPVDDANNTRIGVSVNIPLFTGFDRTYKIKEAREQLNAQKAIRDEAVNNALLDVWRSYNNYLTTRDTLGTVNTLLQSAGKSNEVALGRYKAGAGSLTDMLNAQAQLASARQQYVQSQYSWLVARADMLRALGQLDLGSLKLEPKTVEKPEAETPVLEAVEEPTLPVIETVAEKNQEEKSELPSPLPVLMPIDEPAKAP